LENSMTLILPANPVYLPMIDTCLILVIYGVKKNIRKTRDDLDQNIK